MSLQKIQCNVQFKECFNRSCLILRYPTLIPPPMMNDSVRCPLPKQEMNGKHISETAMSHSHGSRSHGTNAENNRKKQPWIYLFYGPTAKAYFRRVIKFCNQNNTLSSTLKHFSQSENVCVHGDPISCREVGYIELLLGFAPALFSNLQRAQ